MSNSSQDLVSLIGSFQNQLPPELYKICSKLASVTQEAVKNKLRMAEKEEQYKSQIASLERRLASQRSAQRPSTKFTSKYQRRSDKYRKLLQEHGIAVDNSASSDETQSESEEDPTALTQLDTSRSPRTTLPAKARPTPQPHADNKLPQPAQSPNQPELYLDPSIGSISSSLRKTINVNKRKSSFRPSESPRLLDEHLQEPLDHYSLYSTFLTSSPPIPLRWHKLYITRLSSFIAELYNTTDPPSLQSNLQPADIYDTSSELQTDLVSNLELPPTLLDSFQFIILMTKQFYNSYTFLATLSTVIVPLLRLSRPTLDPQTNVPTTFATTAQQQQSWIELKHFHSLLLFITVLLACHSQVEVQNENEQQAVLRNELQLVFAQQFAEEQEETRQELVQQRKDERALQTLREKRKQEKMLKKLEREKASNANKKTSGKHAAPTMGDDGDSDHDDVEPTVHGQDGKDDFDDKDFEDIVMDTTPERSPEYKELFQWGGALGGIAMGEVMKILKTNLLLQPPHNYFPFSPPQTSLEEFEQTHRPATISGFVSQHDAISDDPKQQQQQQQQQREKKKGNKIKGNVLNTVEGTTTPNDEYTFWDAYRVNYGAIVQFKYGLLSMLLSFPDLALKYQPSITSEPTEYKLINQFFWWNTLFNLISEPIQAITFDDSDHSQSPPLDSTTHSSQTPAQIRDFTKDPKILRLDPDYTITTILLFWFFSPYPLHLSTLQSPLYNYLNNTQPVLLMHKHNHHHFALFPDTPLLASRPSSQSLHTPNPHTELPQLSISATKNLIAFFQEAATLQLSLLLNTLIASAQVNIQQGPQIKLMYSKTAMLYNRYKSAIYTHNGCSLDPQSYITHGQSVVYSAIPSQCRCCVVALANFILSPPNHNTLESQPSSSIPSSISHPLFYKTSDIEYLARQTLPHKQRLLSILLAQSRLSYPVPTSSSSSTSQPTFKNAKLLRLFSTTEHFASFLLQSTPWHQNYILLKHTLFPFWTSLLGSIVPPNSQQPSNVRTTPIYSQISTQQFTIATFQFATLLYGMIPSLIMQLHHNPQPPPTIPSLSVKSSETEQLPDQNPNSTTTLIMLLITNVSSALDSFILACTSPDDLLLEESTITATSKQVLDHPETSPVYHFLLRARYYIKHLLDQNLTPYTAQQIESAPTHPAPLQPLGRIPAIELSQVLINLSTSFHDTCAQPEDSVDQSDSESSEPSSRPANPWVDWKLTHEVAGNTYLYSPEMIKQIRDTFLSNVQQEHQIKHERKITKQQQRRAAKSKGQSTPGKK